MQEKDRQTILAAEGRVKGFSHYQCKSNGVVDSAGALPLDKRPAAQLLKSKCKFTPKTDYGAGGDFVWLKDEDDSFDKEQLDPIEISGLDDNGEPLILTASRQNRLIRSRQVIVNTRQFPPGKLSEYVNNDSTPESFEVSDGKQNYTEYYKDLAPSICIPQEVDYLVDYDSSSGQAVAVSRSGTIQEDDPTVLLLSVTALPDYSLRRIRERNGVGGTASEYLENMFRVLFYTTLMNGRRFIALPAAGLGVFIDPNKANAEISANEYFGALFKVAQEYPGLNIIYNPSDKYREQFQRVAGRHRQVRNLKETKTDVMFLAYDLSQHGHPCAYHNPSDPAVVLQRKNSYYGVGMFWRTGRPGPSFVGEEMVGICTTGPLAHRTLDKKLYDNIIETNCKLPELTDKKIAEIMEELLLRVKYSESQTVRTETLNWAMQQICMLYASYSTIGTLTLAIEKYCLLAANVKDDATDFYSLLMLQEVEAFIQSKIPVVKEKKNEIPPRALEEKKVDTAPITLPFPHIEEVAKLQEKITHLETNLSAHLNTDAKTYITEIKTSLNTILRNKKTDYNTLALLNELMNYLVDGLTSKKWETLNVKWGEWFKRSISGLQRTRNFLAEIQRNNCELTRERLNQFMEQGKQVKTHLQGSLFLLRKQEPAEQKGKGKEKKTGAPGGQGQNAKADKKADELNDILNCPVRLSN